MTTNHNRSRPGEPSSVGLADEPTGDLDSETANEIMEVLVDLNREWQLTFILVTHALDIGAHSGRIVRMRDGLMVDQHIGMVQDS